MDDGYYWYMPRLHEDIPDLSDRQIVEVHHGDMVSLCGSDVGYNVNECKGTFVKIPDSGVMRPHSPKPCTCEGAQVEVTVRKGDTIGLRYCEHCGGGIVSITPRRRTR